jgi:hypothetical protein
MAKSTAKGTTAAADLAETVTEAVDEAAAAAETGKSRFTKAVEDAKASAEKLKGEAMERGAAYKATVAEKAGDWSEDAKVYAGQAKEKAISLATDGKSKASDALTVLGKTISDTAGTIDESWAQYGDYARSAARSIQETAAKLDRRTFPNSATMEGIRSQEPGHRDRHRRRRGLLLARLVRGSGDGDA